jgi:hypothetical protein
MKAAGKWGGILVLIALLISLLKTIITFIGFLTGAIKILIIVGFIDLVLGIALMGLEGWKEARREGE